jgi:hypothetical protein
VKSDPTDPWQKREMTDPWLRTLRPPERGRVEIRDSREAGLLLRLTPTGAMTWALRVLTRDARHTRIRLGAYPALSLAEARRAARAARVAVEGGADPVADKRTARAERARRAAAPTVAERLAEWRGLRERDPHRPWSARYAGEVRRLAEREVEPALGARPLAEVGRQDWVDLVTRTRRRAPALGASLYRVLSSFLAHAEAAGWIEAHPLPRKGAALLAPGAAPRERVLTDDELRSLWRASEGLNPKPRAFVRLLVLTAAREMEVADIAAGEVDRAAGRWRIAGARTKNGIRHTVPLCPLALAELDAVWPADGEGAAGAGGRLLGAVTGGGLRGFSKLKARLDALSGVTGWRWHDLRRTARTGMTRLGVPRDHAEAAINHVSGRSALERTYNRHDYAVEVASALGRWQAHVAVLTGTAD